MVLVLELAHFALELLHAGFLSWPLVGDALVFQALLQDLDLVLELGDDALLSGECVLRRRRHVPVELRLDDRVRF